MKKEERRGKGSPRARLGAFFVLFLFGFGILNFFHKDRSFSETENRILEQKPAWQAASVLDGRLMSSFERYQTDQFVFRDGFIQIRTAADWLRGSRESGDVFLGRERTLYEKPEKLQEHTWENLDALSQFAGRHPELPVYLMLAPDAAGVSPEGLPPFAPVEAQKEQLEEISRYLNGAVKEIPVWDVLREHREEYIYYRTDHHWTTLGAWYACEKAVEVMGLNPVEGEPPLYTASDSFEGTLASRSGYRVPADEIQIFWPGEQTELVVTYVQEQEKSASLYEPEKLKTKDKYGIFMNGNHPLTEIRTLADSDRKLLLVKDSYANCFVPFLTSQFREIVMVDPRYYYGNLEELLQQYGFTDVLFLYNMNTFLKDDVLHFALEEPSSSEQ